jgi:hypothetical protein
MRHARLHVTEAALDRFRPCDTHGDSLLLRRRRRRRRRRKAEKKL